MVHICEGTANLSWVCRKPQQNGQQPTSFCKCVRMPVHPWWILKLLLRLFFFQATSAEESEGSEVTGGPRTKSTAPTASSAQPKQTNRSKENLPPSDQKTNADSHAVSSCIIPINVTGKLRSHMLGDKYCSIHCCFLTTKSNHDLKHWRQKCHISHN